MNPSHNQKQGMGLRDLCTWRSQTASTMPAVADEDLVADVDEPPDYPSALEADFHKSMIRSQPCRKESLLTKALLKGPETEAKSEMKSEIQLTTELSRRRSMISNASIASTAELTSDGGLTSPARTNTPSPPLPNTGYTSFAPYVSNEKARYPVTLHSVDVDPIKTVVAESTDIGTKLVISKLPVEDPPRKRCITFACGGGGRKVTAPEPAVVQTAAVPDTPKRQCTIKFACALPKPVVGPCETETLDVLVAPKSTETQKRTSSRSPSLIRKSPRPSLARLQRDSSATIRKASKSPTTLRAKPKYIIADEDDIQASEATRFHEFASAELQDDDWIRKDSDDHKQKLTINDTLKKENAIRQLGNEAEAEALEEEEEEDEEADDQDANDSNSENDLEEDDIDEDFDEDFDESNEEASDGNETDNEAGFAESDDESDGEGEYSFWTLGGLFGPRKSSGDMTVAYRASAHMIASASSIDSLNHMSPPKNAAKIKRPRRRPIKIRPGTPDLPDSTDFVCGTLDEDRPLEEAYVSCMEARKNAKHKHCPQDIDPSFPNSGSENEEDEIDATGSVHDSEEHVWLHGKFEDSDSESRRRPHANRRQSAVSPRRFRSPPPTRRHHSPAPKTRLRSPPPRKLFSQSPKHAHSPPLARNIRSPVGSPTSQKVSRAVTFIPLGLRPGLTHTKSLPRTPNAFCRQYQASREEAADDDLDGGEMGDGHHVRKAIDIVKGLERKRQRRKEKYNRKGKGQPDRKPQPGKGAERMRERVRGSGKMQNPYMMSV